MRLIPISDEEYEVIKKNREIPSNMNHSFAMKILANDNNIFFPNNATNGDVFKTVFSDSTNEDDYKWLSRGWCDWWNAPYLKDGKVQSQLPTQVEGITPTIVADAFEDAISYILKKMWNWRGKDTASIDKVAMEQIIHDELPSAVFHQKGGKE